MEEKVTSEPAKVEEKNKTKSGKGLVIATAVAFVIAAGGVGLGVYGLIKSSEKDTQISTLKSEINTLKNSQTDPYESFAENLVKNNSTTVFGYYQHWTGSQNQIKTVSAAIKDAHLTIKDIDNGNATIAEADGIISVHFVEVGNGGVPYLYLIKKDGTVARIDIAENGTRKIETLDEYSKIVSIYAGADQFAHLIDINGNTYKNL